LWDINYKKYIYDIYEYFLVPLFIIIFNHPPHRVSQGAIIVIKEIGDWCIGKYYTYFKIYGCSQAPHILPKYVPKKLLAKEIAYQIVGDGTSYFLLEISKRLWPRFPIRVGRFTLLNVPHA
jgi:hypothetical protein